jgi:hypothetical protein
VSPTSINITGADGVLHTIPIPMTGREVAALRTQRSELSDQLISAANRRHALSEELKSASPGPSRTGLEQRIEVLDKRIVQIESDIATTGQQLSNAPLSAIANSRSDNGGDIPRNVMQMSGMFIVFVLFPLTLTLSRFLWKKASGPKAVPSQLPADTTHRLERLEHGVDAIAIEIERVAEGQRFVTRLLSEASKVPLQAVSEGSKEAVDRHS